MVVPAAWLERVQQAAPIVDKCTHYQSGLPIWIAGRLYREFRQIDNLSPLVMEGLLLELLAEMSRQAINVRGTATPRWLKEARDYLHEHFTDGISAEAVSVAVNVHPSHLMREFRKRYGCTIGDYVRQLRVERACSLLSTSDIPPAEIAHTLGFADQSHFNRTFKCGIGMTPTEFRKNSGRATPRQETQL